MQTFLPYPNFRQSLECLDDKRLGKQRVEAMQIINTLRFGGGWEKHPAVKMWSRNINELMLYHDMAIKIWKERGFKNTMKFFTGESGADMIHGYRGNYSMPSWFGNEEFHRSHQSNLVRKKPDHYRKYFPNVPDDLEYVWPV